ncbi:hypothetical protein LOC71_13490 [Rhodopirellula sp. JC740]|uniref:Xylose isomerase-like TIM barrel domain-containing protein n=1 Tax=Rhodopirellula halodulae TaxID=2894198 RepID=A0ABS8NI99_9BACT|nr:hypothetical protein [Rhodopirellula sp. JC740]MCC9643293.1 hypothetical protein [Rhodopirellula sp. JC740]
MCFNAETLGRGDAMKRIALLPCVLAALRFRLLGVWLNAARLAALRERACALQPDLTVCGLEVCDDGTSSPSVESKRGTAERSATLLADAARAARCRTNQIAMCFNAETLGRGDTMKRIALRPRVLATLRFQRLTLV